VNGRTVQVSNSDVINLKIRITSPVDIRDVKEQFADTHYGAIAIKIWESFNYVSPK